MQFNDFLPIVTAFQEKSKDISKFVLPDWVAMKNQMHAEKSDLTLLVAHRLCTKTINLKLAMYALLQDKNIYATKIVYRSLIEHNVKNQYFILNPRQMPNLGEFYLEFGEVEEHIAMLKAQRSFSSLEAPAGNTLWQEVFETYPHLAGKQGEITEAINVFAFKNMTIEIARQLKEHAGNLNHFENMLRNYWLCSPFVHGGPGAEDALYKSFSALDPEEQKDLLNLIQIPFYMAYENMQFILFQGKHLSQRSRVCYDYIGKILDEMREKHAKSG